jgi:septal ring factor EnvC (AmiA/AmiB activator)
MKTEAAGDQIKSDIDGKEMGEQLPDEAALISSDEPASETTGNKTDHVKRALRTAAGWVIGVLAVFSLGFLTAAILLYLPSKQRLDNTTANLNKAQQTVAVQADEIAALEAFRNSQENDLAAVRLNVAVTRVELEVMEASLAVVENNYSRASLSIDRAELALRDLEAQISGKQDSVMADLHKKLAQARSKAMGNLRTALPELRILSGDLDKLKDTLVAFP